MFISSGVVMVTSRGAKSSLASRFMWKLYMESD